MDLIDVVIRELLIVLKLFKVYMHAFTPEQAQIPSNQMIGDIKVLLVENTRYLFILKNLL